MVETNVAVESKDNGGTVYSGWSESDIENIVDRMHDFDEITVYEFREELNNWLRNTVGLNSHHETIRSLNNPELSNIDVEKVFEAYTEKVKEEEISGHLAAEGLDISHRDLKHDKPEDFDEEDLVIEDYSAQIAGEEFFGVNRHLSDLPEIRDVQWWVLESDGDWQEESRNPAGEHLFHSEQGEGKKMYVEVNGEPLQPTELEGLLETISIRREIETGFDTEIPDLMMQSESIEGLEALYDGDKPFNQALNEAKAQGYVTSQNDLTLLGYLTQFDMDDEGIERMNFVQAAREGPLKMYEDGWLEITETTIDNLTLGNPYQDSSTENTSETNNYSTTKNKINKNSIAYDGGMPLDVSERAELIEQRDLVETLGLELDEIEELFKQAVDEIYQAGEDFVVRSENPVFSLSNLVPGRRRISRPEAPDPDSSGNNRTIYNYNLDAEKMYQKAKEGFLDYKPVEPSQTPLQTTGNSLRGQSEVLIDRGIAELYSIEEELEQQDVDIPPIDTERSYSFNIDVDELSEDAESHLLALDALEYLSFDPASGDIQTKNRNSNHTKYVLPVDIEIQPETLQMQGAKLLEDSLGYEWTGDSYEASNSMKKVEEAFNPRVKGPDAYQNVVLETNI